MTDQTSNDTAAQLAALLTQMQGQGGASAAPSAWGKPAMQPSPAECLGVAVPISLDTPAGKIRVYLNFPGSCAASPDALMALIQQLAAAGLPLDAWQPRENSSGGGSWGGSQGGNGGGWGNRGGGYGGNRGGYNNNGGGWKR